MHQERLLLRLYRYRNEPDDQLNEYAGMLESPVLVRFYESVQSGMMEAMHQAMTAVARTMQSRGRK
jgi:hypothetical protein